MYIYALEPTQDMQAYFATVARLFEMAVAKQFFAMTSELTWADLFVHSIDRSVLTTAALLRSNQKIFLADAIHVATALNSNADFFIT